MNRPTMHTDPAGTVGAVGAAVGAILSLLVAFGIEFTQEQTEAILATVATIGPISVALWIRTRAWAPATHEAAMHLIASTRPPPFVNAPDEPTR